MKLNQEFVKFNLIDCVKYVNTQPYNILFCVLWKKEKGLGFAKHYIFL